MLTLTGDKRELRQAHRLLAGAFKRIGAKKIRTTVGFPGGTMENVPALWSEKLGFWAAFLSLNLGQYHKYWNAFGTQKPADRGQVSITCEINFPLSGLSARFQGGIARDAAGRLFLVHTGVTGGAQRRTANDFWKVYRGPAETVTFGKQDKSVARLGPLDSPGLPRQLKRFVDTVAFIKGNALPSRFTGPKQGQGFEVDPRARRAVEKYAEKMACAYYRAQGYRVRRQGAPYDLCCTTRGKVIYVEVKGTRGSAEQVFVTAGEISWARADPAELFVVSGIHLSNRLKCTGGQHLVVRPWKPADRDLEALTYRYAIRSKGNDNPPASRSQRADRKPSPRSPRSAVARSR